ncbi:hypothetical protein NA78x_002518 [Anatilimnocola sp. NA78]|uniref:hypothetical protein n=1 Tax=Anatilimnocola sp. NA78 TaxID=3415683 RepID=UPI003CE587BE
MMLHCRQLAIASTLFVLFCGCDGGASGGRHGVSGKVTFQGQPLKTGSIEFTSPEGERGGASIVDGAYSIPAAKGLLPGVYTARVSSVLSAQPAPAMPGESAAIEKSNKDQIPAEFNTQSKLTHEVGSGKPAEFNVTIP